MRHHRSLVLAELNIFIGGKHGDTRERGGQLRCVWMNQFVMVIKFKAKLGGETPRLVHLVVLLSKGTILIVRQEVGISN